MASRDVEVTIVGVAKRPGAGKHLWVLGCATCHEAAEREIARLSEALWECMKQAGADTSYADSADHAYRLGHLPESAVEAVKELRADYTEAGGG